MGAGRGAGGAIQVCRRALRRFRGRLRLAFCGLGAERRLSTTFSFLHRASGPAPRPPSGGSPACICPRGRSGRRRAWPGRSRLPLRPRAATSLRPWLPFTGVGPRWLTSFPPCSVSPPLLFLPRLCALWLWGWAVTSGPVWRRRDWPARAIKETAFLFTPVPTVGRERG